MHFSKCFGIYSLFVQLTWAKISHISPKVKSFPRSGTGAVFASIGTVSFNAPLKLDVLLEHGPLAQELDLQVTAAQSYLAQIKTKIGSFPEHAQDLLAADTASIDRILKSLRRDKQQLHNLVASLFSNRKTNLRSCANDWPISNQIISSPSGKFVINRDLYLNGTADARTTLASTTKNALTSLSDWKWELESFINNTDLELDPELHITNLWQSMATTIRQDLLTTQRHVGFTTNLIADLLSTNTQQDMRNLPRIKALLNESAALLFPFAAPLLRKLEAMETSTFTSKIQICQSSNAFRVTLDILLPYSQAEFDLFVVLEVPVDLGNDLALIVQNSNSSSAQFLAVDPRRTTFVEIPADDLKTCGEQKNQYSCPPRFQKLNTQTATCNVARFQNDKIKADKECHKAIVRHKQAKSALLFPSTDETIIFSGHSTKMIYHCDDNCSNPLSLEITEYSIITTNCRLVLDDFSRKTSILITPLYDDKHQLMVEPIWTDLFFFFTVETLQETLLRVKDTVLNINDLAKPLPMTKLLPNMFDRQHCDWLCRFSIQLNRVANFLGIPVAIIHVLGLIFLCLSFLALILTLRVAVNWLTRGFTENRQAAPQSSRRDSRPIFPYDNEQDNNTSADYEEYRYSPGNVSIGLFPQNSIAFQNAQAARDNYSARPNNITSCSSPHQFNSREPTISSRLSLHLSPDSPEYLQMIPIHRAAVHAISEQIISRKISPVQTHITTNLADLDSTNTDNAEAIEMHTLISTFAHSHNSEHNYTTVLARPNELLPALPEYINFPHA